MTHKNYFVIQGSGVVVAQQAAGADVPRACGARAAAQPFRYMPNVLNFSSSQYNYNVVISPHEFN